MRALSKFVVVKGLAVLNAVGLEEVESAFY